MQQLNMVRTSSEIISHSLNKHALLINSLFFIMASLTISHEEWSLCQYCSCQAAWYILLFEISGYNTTTQLDLHHFGSCKLKSKTKTKSDWTEVMWPQLFLNAFEIHDPITIQCPFLMQCASRIWKRQEFLAGWLDSEARSIFFSKRPCHSYKT